MTKVRTVLIAWFLSVLIVGIGGAALHFTYDPVAEQQAIEQAALEQAAKEEERRKREVAQSLDAPKPVEKLTADPTVDDLLAQSRTSSSPQVSANTQRGSNRPLIRARNLPSTAIPDLLQASVHGPIPRKAVDGRTPFTEYSATDPSGARGPRVAIMITDMGKNRRMTRHAIDTMPREISFAFSPYGRKLKDYGIEARAAGHEVFLELPMEPLTYPQDDPGPLALLTANSDRHNLANFQKILSLFEGYVGLASAMGSRFASDENKLSPILEDMQRRGLMYVDAKTTQFTRAPVMAKALQMPVAINNRLIDQELTVPEINQALIALEDRALQNGVALGFASNKKISIDTINAWANSLMSRGITLVPVSAIANTQRIQ